MNLYRLIRQEKFFLQNDYGSMKSQYTIFFVSFGCIELLTAVLLAKVYERLIVELYIFETLPKGCITKKSAWLVKPMGKSDWDLCPLSVYSDAFCTGRAREGQIDKAMFQFIDVTASGI